MNSVQSLCIQFKFTFSPLSFDTCLLSFISHLLPRIILSTSEEACCREKIVRYKNSLSKTQLFSRQILTCQKHIHKFNKKTNNLLLNTRPDAGKNLKDGRSEKLRHKNLCKLFPQKPSLSCLCLYVNKQVKLPVMWQQNFQILVWVKEGRNSTERANEEGTLDSELLKTWNHVG